MPVVDASVIAEYLSGGPHADVAEAFIVGERTLWAPQLIDAEVGHVLRRVVAVGELSAQSGEAAIRDLIDLPIVRAGHTGLVERAWETRENISFSDALYVALAERVRAPLLTLDGRIARAAESLVEVVVLGDGPTGR